MNGIYWGLTALALMGSQDALPREEMIKWVMNCWNDDVGQYKSRCGRAGANASSRSLFAGGFAPHPGHDAHIHPTLSAIQILAMQDSLDLLDKDKIVACAVFLSRSLLSRQTQLSSHHRHPLPPIPDDRLVRRR
jgi:geranylgeranyl transferase type-2 subunit beta